MGNIDQEIADYTEAIRIEPASTYYSNRAAAYLDKKDYDRAIADSTEALRLFPGNWRAYYIRALAYEAMRDYDRAIADHEAILRINPNDDYAKEDIERVRRLRGR